MATLFLPKMCQMPKTRNQKKTRRAPGYAYQGFTLIELMLVLLMVGILLLLAVPSYQGQTIRQQVKESLAMVEQIKAIETQHYQLLGAFPADNASAGLPASNKYIGLYVRDILIDSGAIHITFGNRINKKAYGKILTLRPAIVPQEPMVPIAWICGNAPVPEGMVAAGENRTDLPGASLPVGCR